MIDICLLSDAVSALEIMMKGQRPASLQALAGGFGLDCLSYEKKLDALLAHDLAEVAQGLFRIARGELWGPEFPERERLIQLMAIVREIIELAHAAPVSLH